MPKGTGYKHVAIEEAKGGFILNMYEPNKTKEADALRAKGDYVDMIETKKVASNIPEVVNSIVDFFGGNAKMKKFGLG